MTNSSSSEVITHETAAPATMAFIDAGTTPALRGVPLNDCWKIRDQLPTDKQKHATVYLVLDKAGLPVENLEAHAFALDGTQPKVRKHRLRCIKRMTTRTKLEIRVRDVAIIVISTSPSTDSETSEKDEMIDGPMARGNGLKSDRKAAKKTPYKQQSARIRQRERRKARRSESVEQHPNTAYSKHNGTRTAYWDDIQTGYMAFLNLYWIILTEEVTRGEVFPFNWYIKLTGSESLYRTLVNLPDAFFEALEEYFKETFKLDWPSDMESYLKGQQGAMISLKRQLARLPSAEKYHHDKLGTLNREQMQYQKDSEKWQQIEFGPKVEAVLQCQIVAQARTVLPQIVEFRKAHIKDIKLRCWQAFYELASAEMQEERERIMRSMAQYEAWAQTVSPQVVFRSHAKLLMHLEEAMIELTGFDQIHFSQQLTM
ncbi:hypothetical protein F5883DRAFT_574694 [Diaporthe sp. PMI_573]|nr:hypothetical protein F5883DRAFT_574694 [Diaporthaceae sp. PMI_573]